MFLQQQLDNPPEEAAELSELEEGFGEQVDDYGFEP
jgi:hypothetical protein